MIIHFQVYICKDNEKKNESATTSKKAITRLTYDIKEALRRIEIHTTFLKRSLAY